MAWPRRKEEPPQSFIHIASDRSEIITKKRKSNRNRFIAGFFVLVVLALFSLLFHPVALSWQPSPDAGALIVYKVYRADGACSSNIAPRLIGTTSKLHYNDASIKFGTFCYTVRASANGQMSTPSNVAEVRVRPTFRH